MELDWEQHDKPDEFGTEYRCWGVASPYRLLVKCGYVILTQYGTGRAPHWVSYRNEKTLASMKAVAQQWEDEQQSKLDKIGEMSNAE